MSKTLRKFRVTNGSHSQDGKVYFGPDLNRGKRFGDVVSSPHDLVKQWPNKFEEVSSETPITKSAVSVITGGQIEEPAPAGPSTTAPGAKGVEGVTKPGPDDDEDETGEAGAPSDLGQDVTEKFPKAVEQDFKVFKREGQYFVYDVDDLTKPVGAGTKKVGVDEVIATALKGK